MFQLTGVNLSLIITFSPTTLEPVYNVTLFSYCFSVLWEHQQILQHVPSFKMLLDTILATDGLCSPKLYGLPKIHKKNNPLRPIVSSRGSVTYGVAKEVPRILKPLTGNTIHHINNSKKFADDMKETRLEKGECIITYDLSVLFISIPVTSAIQVTKNNLEQDTELHQRTTMSAYNIWELLEFCLCNTYFLFQGQFYQ